MNKDFDRWSKSKKEIDSNLCQVVFHEREIWWCSIGINVGYEQHSQSKDFSRPVLVVRKFTSDIFWGIPMTTKIRDGGYRIRFSLEDKDNDVLVLQMRAYDRKRLVRKIAVMPKESFKETTDYIKSLL